MAIAKAALTVGGRRHRRPNLAKQRARHARRGRLFRTALTTLLVVMWASGSVTTTKAAAAAAAERVERMELMDGIQCVYDNTDDDAVNVSVNMEADVDVEANVSPVNLEANIDAPAAVPVPESAPRGPASERRAGSSCRGRSSAVTAPAVTSISRRSSP